jgi:hypothetical protein
LCLCGAGHQRVELVGDVGLDDDRGPAAMHECRRGPNASVRDRSEEVGFRLHGRGRFAGGEVEERECGPGAVGQGHQVAAVEHATDTAVLGLPLGRRDDGVDGCLDDVDVHRLGQWHLRAQRFGEWVIGDGHGGSPWDSWAGSTEPPSTDRSCGA